MCQSTDVQNHICANKTRSMYVRNVCLLLNPAMSLVRTYMSSVCQSYEIKHSFKFCIRYNFSIVLCFHLPKDVL